jgi:hypothetical protein
MRTLRLGLLALALGLLLGCGRGSQVPAKVSGKVTYKGQPVPAGSITFHSEDKGSYSGTLGEGGAYEIPDLPAGTLKVTVETESVNPNKKNPTYEKGRGGAIDNEYQKAMQRPGQNDAGKNYVKIPAKYAKPETTDLSVTLKAGKQTQDFELKD